MKAFLIGVCAMVAISAVAAYALDTLSASTAEARQSQAGSVRLDNSEAQ